MAYLTVFFAGTVWRSLIPILTSNDVPAAFPYVKENVSRVPSNFKSNTHPIRKFNMPIKGNTFEIFQPLYDMDDAKKNKQLLASPQDFIQTFEERISWVDTTMVAKPLEFKEKTTKEHASLMYLEMIKSFVSDIVFNANAAELSVSPVTNLGAKLHETQKLDTNKHTRGVDWTYAGDTMTGMKRLNNVADLLSDVIQNGINGDYIET